MPCNVIYHNVVVFPPIAVQCGAMHSIIMQCNLLQGDHLWNLIWGSVQSVHLRSVLHKFDLLILHKSSVHTLHCTLHTVQCTLWAGLLLKTELYVKRFEMEDQLWSSLNSTLLKFRVSWILCCTASQWFGFKVLREVPRMLWSISKAKAISELSWVEILSFSRWIKGRLNLNFLLKGRHQ